MHVFYELVRVGDDAITPLLRAGFVPIRLMDHLAHGLSPEQSDERAEGTIEPAARLDAESLRVVLLDDPYTPFVVVTRLLYAHVGLDSLRADEIARGANTDGRAIVGAFPRGAAERIARKLMMEARRAGAPLLVELDADEEAF